MRSLRFITPQFSRIQKILNLQNPNFQYSKTLASSSSQSKLHELHLSRNYTTASPEQRPPPPERVSAIAEEISGLTLLEVADLTEVLRDKLGVKEMPTMAIMMPGMGFGDLSGTARGGPGADKGEEKKAEKTAFDLKLEGFDAASKIKVIKEVRSFTDLGLKEAKDLVEKAPTLLKKGVAKEEAEAIIAKMKEVGAKVSME